ncbi:MAG: hypothetical protein PHX74_11235, partial [Candidatus Sumerlaeales bacterium]|nr:hypothetical protein [Candidatus Sumerlaeales bacterium]
SGTISTVGYFYDRWMLNSGSVVTNAAYLTLGAGTEIEQRIEGTLLAGETVTVSAMAGGTVFIGTGTMPISGTASVTLAGWGTATLGYATGYMYVRLAPTAASNVVRVKLEFGTVSTLAYDPPMDYAVELLKCQRFMRMASGPVWNAGLIDNSLAIEFEIPYPDGMRITPTLILSSNLTDAILLPGTSWHTPTLLGQNYDATHNVFYITFSLPEAVAGRFFAFMSHTKCYFTSDL